LVMETAEVVIAGGGVVGCAIAYHLARRGVDVLVLERAELGSGSTGRCAGGVRQQFSSEANVRLQRLALRELLSFDEQAGGPAPRPSRRATPRPPGATAPASGSRSL